MCADDDRSIIARAQRWVIDRLSIRSFESAGAQNAWCRGADGRTEGACHLVTAIGTFDTLSAGSLVGGQRAPTAAAPR